jgi:hypothetical protein
MIDYKYPKSFPNKEEQKFLTLIFSNENDFIDLWEKWKKDINFNNINYSVLRLMPLLYLRLKKFNVVDGPIGRIKGMYKMAWYKNQMILDSVRKVILLFNEANIPVVLLKGVPLIENVYKDKGARCLGDADILISPKYLEKAMEIMVHNGWDYFNKSPFYINRFKAPLENKILKEVTFSNNQNTEIDIHWSLFMFLFKENKSHLMSYDEIFKYTSDFDLKGAKYKMPCIEDMIIHIVVHGAEGNNHRTLRWVADVVTIIKTMPVDWIFLLERTKKFEVVMEINVAFSYLYKNYSFLIPESFIEQLKEIPIEKDKVKEYYITTNTINKSLFGTLLYLWRGYWLHERKGKFPVSLYYFIDYICKSWGINKKRQIPAFIFEKYKIRIVKIFHR